MVDLVEEGARMSTAVSPLAPTDVPEMPAIAGVKLATAAAGIRYKGRTDVLLAVMDKGTTVAGVFTKSKCPSAPVEWCRAKLGRGASPRAGGEFRQRQRVHRQDRQAVDGADRANRSEGGRLHHRRRVPRLHRRDRRAARRHQIRRRAGDAGRGRHARPLDGRRQGDHDHRYLPEGRNRHGETRQGQSDHQRHGQGRRHDHARYGDHAVLCVHRRAAVVGRAAVAAQERRRGYLQCRHHRQRHLDIGHAAGLRHRRGRRQRRTKDQPRQRSAG